LKPDTGIPPFILIVLISGFFIYIFAIFLARILMVISGGNRRHSNSLFYIKHNGYGPIIAAEEPKEPDLEVGLTIVTGSTGGEVFHDSEVENWNLNVEESWVLSS
jgi:hypothetical protein